MLSLGDFLWAQVIFIELFWAPMETFSAQSARLSLMSLYGYHWSVSDHFETNEPNEPLWATVSPWVQQMSANSFLRIQILNPGDFHRALLSHDAVFIEPNDPFSAQYIMFSPISPFQPNEHVWA